MATGLAIVSCSTAQVAQAPKPIQPPEKAAVLELPHPEGHEVHHLAALLRLAPASESFQECFKTQHDLASKTGNPLEVDSGVQELVSENPTFHHWCFYRALHGLDTELQSTSGILSKQKEVLATYRDLLPVARAFQSEFKDSRYLRWAIQNYRRLSPKIFFRTVELTPDATADLVLIEEPFSDWKLQPSEQSVLKKYGLKDDAVRTPASSTSEAAAPVPTSSPMPSVSPVPSTDLTPAPTPTAALSPASAPDSAAPPSASIPLQEAATSTEAPTLKTADSPVVASPTPNATPSETTAAAKPQDQPASGSSPSEGLAREEPSRAPATEPAPPAITPPPAAESPAAENLDDMFDSSIKTDDSSPTP
jgi:hypothetical protein